MNDRLRFELVALFGCYRVDMAETLDVVDMNLTAATMDAVQTAADALLKLSGQGRRQQDLVAALDGTTSLVLCMWLMDTGFADPFYFTAA